jgi:S1-C subfamily serine protease
MKIKFRFAAMLIVYNLCCAHLFAQDTGLLDGCTRLVFKSNNDMQDGQWQALIDAAQQYMQFCKEVATKDDQVMTLAEIGVGLDKLTRYSDAIPVLRRCELLDPDATPCLVYLGFSYWRVGKIEDARAYFQKCINIGATTEMNAQMIANARFYLVELNRQHPEGGSSQGEEDAQRSYGTGFFVSREGHILTNNHVVARCKTLVTKDGKPLQIIARDVSADLALVKAEVSPSNVVVFRTGAPPSIGDGVIVFGFPLPGVLSSEGNVTTGVLSATTGIRDDVRLLQITAPIQPGNSGGPVFDRSGRVIGVVVAKLDVLQMARVTGDIAQNVNFAVHWATVRSFLDEQRVHYRKDSSQRPVSTATVAASASRVSVTLECSE